MKFEFMTLTVDETGTVMQQKQQSVSGHCQTLNSETSLNLIQIPAGSLMMGCPKSELGWHATQSPQHAVTINAFELGQQPITQKQWQVVAALPPVHCHLAAQPACFFDLDRPVEQVSWDEAVEFCQRLSQLTDSLYRLPSEAEWEYACRAGTTTPFHFGPTLTTDLANYSGIDWDYQGRICSRGAYGKGPLGVDRRETTVVQQFEAANQFGLYNLHGQVREWCQDCWHPDYQQAPTDGRAWIEQGDCQQRVLRGGSWNQSPRSCRSAFRSKLAPEARLYDVGFRVVRELTQ